MECTKCRRILDIKDFSYKNVKQKIFYLHCDKCREKISNQPNKKIAEKEYYETLKKTNLIICPICSREYVSFRTYHTMRHNSSKIHLKFIAKSN
jgi:hypothetical protein